VREGGAVWYYLTPTPLPGERGWGEVGRNRKKKGGEYVSLKMKINLV